MKAEVQAFVDDANWTDAVKSAHDDPSLINYIHQLHLAQIISTAPLDELAKATATESIASLLNDITFDDEEFTLAVSLNIIRSVDSGEVIRLAISKALIFINTGDAMLQMDERVDYQREVGSLERIREMRKYLLAYSDRFDTYEEIWGIALADVASSSPLTAVEGRASLKRRREGRESDDDDEDTLEDDEDGDDSAGGWGDIDMLSEHDEAPHSSLPTAEEYSTHPTLRQFLDQSLLRTALDLASLAEVSALLILCLRHSEALWPTRFAILDAIPEWEEPGRYLALLPGVEGQLGMETRWLSTPWRPIPALDELAGAAMIPSDEQELNEYQRVELLSSEALTAYYLGRIEQIASFGLFSVALTMVQHVVALGVAGLGQIGEELSLLSKLVYDRRPKHLLDESAIDGEQEMEEEEVYTLTAWRALDSTEIVRAYLAHSTPSSICSDLRRLVLPYLSVLESHLERAGTPDSSIATRHVYAYFLHLSARRSVRSSSLSLLVALFEGSKPTLPKSQRVVQSDEDLARLSLACLYGCKETTGEAFTLMGKIFECLPAFDEPSSGTATSTTPATLFELFPAGSSPLDPIAVFDAVRSFPASSLSMALDTLDLHLATAETFSRYVGVAVPLEWFIMSQSDEQAQRERATKMARSLIGHEKSSSVYDIEEEWRGLEEDMMGLILVDGEEADKMKKAFWKLTSGELLKIFYAGVLASGNFALAKSLLHPQSSATPLTPAVEEQLVIAASIEFYDQAESGNLHKGGMKLAFDVLNLVPPSSAIRVELIFQFCPRRQKRRDLLARTEHD